MSALDEGRLTRVRAWEALTVDIVLARSGTISGRVSDPFGRPLKYASVRVAADPDDNRGVGIQTEGVAATDADGAFSIAGLASGVYRVRADPPERESAPDRRAGSSRQSTTRAPAILVMRFRYRSSREKTWPGSI